MARLSGRPNSNRLYDPGLDQSKDDEPYIEEIIAGGIITEVDPANIGNSQLSGGKNITVRADKTSRRPGSSLLSITKPNANRINTLTVLKQFSGDSNLFRFTNSTIHYASGSSWQALTGGVLTTGDVNKYRVVSINNQFFFTNDGVESIQQINFTTNTYAAAGDWGRYRYIIGFGNRLLAAYEISGTNNPVKLAWSGLLNFTISNPLTDPSAGSTALVESPEDYADDITGLFPFGSQVLVMREGSIWLASKQASYAQPFFFSMEVPSIGCDAPNTAVRTPLGLIWYNYKLGNVFIFNVGDKFPTPVADVIRSVLNDNVESPEYVKGSYNFFNNEYTLTSLSTTSSNARIFRYNLYTKTWACEEREGVTCLADVDYDFAQGSIDQLTGTIDQLIVTINELSPSITRATAVYGMSDGEILYEDALVDTDNATSYTTEVISKVFQLPANVQHIRKLEIEYQASKTGSFSVEISRDGGNSFETLGTETISTTNRRILATFKKLIRSRNYTFKITSTSGLFDLLKYAIYVNRAGESRT